MLFSLTEILFKNGKRRIHLSSWIIILSESLILAENLSNLEPHGAINNNVYNAIAQFITSEILFVKDGQDIYTSFFPSYWKVNFREYSYIYEEKNCI